MAKTLLYRLFGVGRIPPAWADVLDREDVLIQDEGIPGSLTYRNFRAPGRYDSWRRQWFPASLVVTRERLLALRGSRPVIDVPRTDARLRQMQFTADGDRLSIAFDAGLFHADWSGSLEYRFRTERAGEVVELLRG